MAVGFARENMSRLQQGVAVRDMVDVPLVLGPLQDGVDEGVIDRLHDESSIRLLLCGHWDVEDAHAPISGVLLPLVKRVAQNRNFGGLLGYHPPKGLLLSGYCDERRLQHLELHHQGRKFNVHLTLHFLHGVGGFGAFFSWFFAFRRGHCVRKKKGVGCQLVYKEKEKMGMGGRSRLSLVSHI